MNSKVVRTIGLVGALWGLGGVGSYLQYVGMFGAPERASGDMPAIVQAAYATSAFAGVIGSIGLVLLKRWSASVLWLAFAAAVVNWAWVFGHGDPAERPLGVAVLGAALALALVATWWRRKDVGAA